MAGWHCSKIMRTSRDDNIDVWHRRLNCQRCDERVQLLGASWRWNPTRRRGNAWLKALPTARAAGPVTFSMSTRETAGETATATCNYSGQTDDNDDTWTSTRVHARTTARQTDANLIDLLQAAEQFMFAQIERSYISRVRIRQSSRSWIAVCVFTACCSRR